MQNNDTSSSEGGIPQIPAYIRNTSMVFCVVIMCLGVIGNIMVPIVIMKTKDMRNSTNIFLTNLSIADLLVLLVCTPTVLVEVNSKPETWVLGQEMCKAVPFVELTVAHASVLTILAISFERYYAICEPLKAGYVCTKTRAILICVLAWIVAALFTSPILLFAEFSNQEEYVDGSRVAVCLTQASNVWTITFFLMTISVFFVLPLMVLIILYTIIAKNLIANDMSLAKMRPNKPELSYKARKQVILMLGAVVMAFFTCLLPFRVLTLWIIIAPDEYMEGLGVEAYYNLLYFCRIMLYLNSAINPILYNLMSSKFRKGFKKLFYCYCLLSICNRKQHKLKMLRRNHNQNSHTTSSNTQTTSLAHTTTNSSRKNSSKISMGPNDGADTKILTTNHLHSVEFHCRSQKDVQMHRLTSQECREAEEEEDEEEDEVNVEYELQLRMIERKNCRRAPFKRQHSTPTPIGTTLEIKRGNWQHRHTIHLSEVEFGRSLMRRNLLLVHSDRRKKGDESHRNDDEFRSASAKNQFVTETTKLNAVTEIKRQDESQRAAAVGVKMEMISSVQINK